MYFVTTSHDHNAKCLLRLNAQCVSIQFRFTKTALKGRRLLAYAMDMVIAFVIVTYCHKNCAVDMYIYRILLAAHL